ncbi:MAG: pyruvate dehydrogenase (acetyl-transferring), homodimeric type, partial [Myxococcota bacterium]
MIEEPDIDSQETEEWLAALDSVFEADGVDRAHYLIERLIDAMRRSGAHLPYKTTTAYVNTISKAMETPMPGEPGIEHRIRSIIRWNALAMVIQ